MLAESAQALRGASSYHVSGMMDRGLTVDVVVTKQGSVGRISSHDVTWDEVAVGGETWFRGAALWRATLPAQQAADLGDNWVLVTMPAAAFGFAGPLHNLQERIPGVVFGPQPKLVNRGLKRVNGRQAVELSSSTDVYDVFADGPHYPVRWLEVEVVGPNGQPCGIALDRFGEPATIVAPMTDKRL